MKFQYNIPTKILFGKGQLSRLSRAGLPGKKAMIVISAGQSVKKFGYLDRVIEQLTAAGVSYVIYDKVLSNPTKDQVMEAAALGKQEGCDFVIGLGGGSSMDSAKAIAVMIPNEGDLWDYFVGGSAKGQRMAKNPLPIVAITTTAGTGSEADPWLVITNTETNEKIGWGGSKTFPVLSIVDPDLMMSVPPRMTAYQGFDALFHSTEGYINLAANPLSDIYALKSISLIGKSLKTAVADGSNVEARTEVALANTLSGLVESTSGCTAEHAIEHALSGLHPQITHGQGLIMISLAYYTFLAKSGKCNQRLIDMAKALGNEGASDPMDFVAGLLQLQKDCGVDELKMSDEGITKEEIGAFAKLSREAGASMYNAEPAGMTDEDVIAILEASYR